MSDEIQYGGPVVFKHPCTSATMHWPNDHVLGERSEEKRSIYHREIRPGVWVDVYDVLDAFGVTSHSDAHAIKKLLMPGQRGTKEAEQDRREAIKSIERTIEMERSR